MNFAMACFVTTGTGILYLLGNLGVRYQKRDWFGFGMILLVSPFPVYQGIVLGLTHLNRPDAFGFLGTLLTIAVSLFFIYRFAWSIWRLWLQPSSLLPTSQSDAELG